VLLVVLLLLSSGVGSLYAQGPERFTENGFEQAGFEQPAPDEAADVGTRQLPRPSTPLASGTQDRKRATSTPGWGSTLSGLVIVLALLGGCAWLFRRGGMRLTGILPADVIQVLGKRYVDHRESIHLVRIGSRILILANSAQHGLRTLGEITDPVEIDFVAGQCREQAPHSMSRNFAELLASESAPGPAPVISPLSALNRGGKRA